MLFSSSLRCMCCNFGFICRSNHHYGDRAADQTHGWADTFYYLREKYERILQTLLRAQLAQVNVFTLAENLYLALCLDAVPTSTQRPVCDTSNTMSCGHPIYHNLNAVYNSPSIWTFISCCYVAPTTTQLTLQFAIQEDDIGYWLLDAVSAE